MPPTFDQRLWGCAAPLKKRTEADGAGGTRTLLGGAQCKLCEHHETKPGSSCTKKSNKVTFLAHLAGEHGDPGGGWARCPRQADLGATLRAELRAEFLELKAADAKKKSEARTRVSSSTASSFASPQEETTPIPTAFDIALGVVSFKDAAPVRKIFTDEDRKAMNKFICMATFEGNMAAYAVAGNGSLQQMISYALQSWDMSGQAYKLPSRKYILGTGLDIAYATIMEEVKSTFNPAGQRACLATDGGDPGCKKNKVINFLGVFALGVVFMQLVDCEGKHANADFLAEQNIKFIDANGGIDLWNQCIMDNTMANVNAWDLIEKHYKFLLICTGCKCHFLQLIYRAAIEDSYASTTFSLVR